jgi:hypothetical protein
MPYEEKYLNTCLCTCKCMEKTTNEKCNFCSSYHKEGVNH